MINGPLNIYTEQKDEKVEFFLKNCQAQHLHLLQSIAFVVLFFSYYIDKLFLRLV